MLTILCKLLFTFWKIGTLSIGGGYAIIPLIQEQVVNTYHWVSQQVFTDIITISQMTPGPLAVNTSTFVGMQIAGLPGAIAATLGCVISGGLISLLLYWFFQKYQRSPYVFGTLNGLKAASLGLITSASATILLLAFCGTSELCQISSIDWISVLLFILSLFVLRKWKVNPILMMAGTGIVGGLLYLS